ncbi:MAG: hypothetical protein JJ934_09850 [Pseudomonadales bacterium]|nr:hypothetical protein [Pseudomonadales bacterium]
MNILVHGNCQVQQLVLGLKLALMGKANVTGLELSNPDTERNLQLLASRSGSSKVDLVITNQDMSRVTKYFDRQAVVEIPIISFGGFHPDVVYFSFNDSPETPGSFMNNPTVSALALWGYMNGYSAEKTLGFYDESVFEALAYMDYFDLACESLLESYRKKGIGSTYLEKHIVSQSVFMFGPLHPRLEVVLSLCFGILEKLELTPVNRYESIVGVVPDPLEPEYNWGCFPPLAERLGLTGSWFVRHWNHVFPTMDHYLRSFYQSLSQYPNRGVRFFERDRLRFHEYHNLDSVLEEFL